MLTPCRALSELSIVAATANFVTRRVTRKVISDLRRMLDTLSGDDSELKTTWDEICVQVQLEESFYWAIYDQTVRTLVDFFLSELALHEREAIWLQTEAGRHWAFDDPNDRDTYPVDNDELIEYITREHVYVEAGRWSNTRIRAFTIRATGRD